MYRLEPLLARIALVVTSLLITFVLIEAASRFYLWHIAPEAAFQRLASINQIKDRYGDDFFGNSIVSQEYLSFTRHPYLGYILTPSYETANAGGGGRINIMPWDSAAMRLNR